MSHECHLVHFLCYCMSRLTFKMKKTFQSINNKMAVDCTRSRLTQCQLLLFGALVFTVEFAIGLFIVTVSLNQQLKNVQLIADAKNNKPSPSQESPVSPGCYCPSKESRTGDYRHHGVDSSQYLNDRLLSESTFSSGARAEQRHDETFIVCCEIDAKTLRKVSCIIL